MQSSTSLCAANRKAPMPSACDVRAGKRVLEELFAGGRLR